MMKRQMLGWEMADLADLLLVLWILWQHVTILLGDTAYDTRITHEFCLNAYTFFRYGMFHQAFDKDGDQVETPDYWLNFGFYYSFAPANVFKVALGKFNALMLLTVYGLEELFVNSIRQILILVEYNIKLDCLTF